jgi:hypothetical protein
VVKANAKGRKVLQQIEERVIGHVVGVREDMVKVADRLMIVKGEDELDGFHER